jgi:hypothetical protein
MTTDEFTDHLLDALHGPRSSDIVARITKVLAAGLRGNSTISELFAAKLAASVDSVLADIQEVACLLAALALIEEEFRVAQLDTSRDGQARVARALAKSRAIVEVLRETEMARSATAMVEWSDSESAATLNTQADEGERS